MIYIYYSFKYIIILFNHIKYIFIIFLDLTKYYTLFLLFPREFVLSFIPPLDEYPNPLFDLERLFPSLSGSATVSVVSIGMNLIRNPIIKVSDAIPKRCRCCIKDRAWVLTALPQNVTIIICPTMIKL